MDLEEEVATLNKELLDAFCDLQEARVHSLQFRPEGHFSGCACSVCGVMNSRVKIATDTYYRLREFLGKTNEPS